jgi:4-aminobutyrate aminotransferase
VVKAALDRDLLLLTCGSHDNVIRWIPPLIVNEAQVKEGLERFEGALS